MPIVKKGPVLRVTGLSASQPDEELVVSLKALIGDELTDEEKTNIVVKVVIVPSCDRSDEEKVALVECRGGWPAFLSDLADDPLSEWQMEMGDTDINFDQHFFGFTQLYTPEQATPIVADIIAITGLDGHAYGSWRGKGNLGRMWLRDFLRKDLPRCRTMTYGYNSKLSSHGVDTIMSYGRGLLEELKKVRDTQELRQRPLFFIAHSFGGIVLAHCLIKAAQITEDHPTIAALHKATYGMLLFGIPHRGLVVDDIQKMLAGEDRHPRIGLLDQIKEKSDLLASQLDSFRNLIQDRKVVSFYEQRQTRQLQFDREKKRWTRTGDFVTQVDSDSALLQLPDSMEEKIALDADHSTMVKFDTSNAIGYSSARAKLLQLARDAPVAVAARFAKVTNEPKPCNMVPFARDNAFVGREDVLAELKEIHSGTASPSHSRAALVGLGGVGKSQIAIEYAYRVREAVPDMWVFWVHASNADRFQQAYREIAVRLELPGRDDPKNDVLQLVYSWLWDERNGRWLVIVDNADDDQVFAPSGTADQGTTSSLASFLPQAAHGWILVTSRDVVAATNLVGARRNVVEVQPMSEQDALTLLMSKTVVEASSNGDAQELVKVLEGIPLAVTHAAAFIEVRRPMVNIAGYLELFHESDANQANLLNDEKTRDLRRDANVSSAVITTWQLSFEQIRKTTPDAANLLSLMTMFDRQGIPEHLLYESKTKLQFTEAVAPLLHFSLVRAQNRQQTERRQQEQLFEMHSLVQLATREWVKSHGEEDAWQETSIRILAAKFPNGDHETWATCRTLLPHSMKVLGYSMGETCTARLDQATIEENMAWYLKTCGQYAEAERHGRSALAVSENVLGSEHSDTLHIVNVVGRALYGQGRYEEAEAMHRRALEGFEKTLGAGHPVTLSTVDLLGSVLSRQGRYKDAEAMHRRALEGFEKTLGAGHPVTLSTVDLLGMVLSEQGRYKDAEAMHRRALEGFEKTPGYGRERRETLISVSRLGWVLHQQGRNKEAEVMFRRSLEGTEKALGREHLDTLVTVGRLGSVLASQGRLVDAKTLQTQVLKARKKILGDNHPHTFNAMHNLALTLRSQGRRCEALPLMEKCVAAQGSTLGLEHPETKSSTARLNHWYSEPIDVVVQKSTRATQRTCTHEDELYWAAGMGNIAAVKILLEKGADPSSTNHEKGTPLNVASYEGHDKVVKLLLAGGADPNIPNNTGATPLYSAALNGYVTVVKMLLEKEAGVSMANNNKWTPLNAASYEGHADVVKVLLAHGADASVTNSTGATPLYSASAKGHVAVVKVLFEQADEVSTTDNDKWTPLHVASSQGHDKVMKLLLDKNADVNVKDSTGATPLYRAAREGHVAAVNMLLGNNADIDIVNFSGSTPLYSAAAEGHVAVVKLLLKKRADVSIANDYWTPLHAASSRGHTEVVELLLAQGANVSIANSHGMTPLHSAALNDHAEIVELLLEHGIDMEALSNHGYTPLTVAAAQGHVKVVQLLLRRGASLSVSAKGSVSPFGAAVREKQFAIIELLLQTEAHLGANTTEPYYGTVVNMLAFKGCTDLLRPIADHDRAQLHLADSHGRTPLHLAARGGHIETFLYLSSEGLDYGAVDEKGDDLISYASNGGSLDIVNAVLGKSVQPINQHGHWTPLHWACRVGHADIVKLLAAAGLRGESVTALDLRGEWTPLAIAVFFGNKDMINALDESAQSAFGAGDPDVYITGLPHRGFTCDGCFYEIVGPRFCCRTCLDFDYCFMCRPFLGHLHEGHGWDVIEPPVPI